MNLVKKLFSILYWLFVLAIVSIAGLIIVSNINTPLGFRVFSVNSGSMEPTISLGSLVVIKPQSNYFENDIITFYSERTTKETVTHRITQIIKNEDSNSLHYETKGDANEDADREPVAARRVVGKVTLAIPLLGYLISFAQSQLGFMVTVVIPATLVVFMEFMDLKKHLVMWFQKRKDNKSQKEDKGVSKKSKSQTVSKIITFFVTLCMLHSVLAPTAYAFYEDTEVSHDNYFGASSLDLNVRTGQSQFFPFNVNLFPGDTVVRDVYVGNLGSLPFEYGMRYDFDSGTELLCEGLELTVYYYWYDTNGVFHEVEKYNGTLADFELNLPGGDSHMINPNSNDYYNNDTYESYEHWYYFELSLPAAADQSLATKTCEFNIEVSAWQEGSSSGVAFGDSESFSSLISTDEWFDNVLQITKYMCPGDTVITQDNRPDADGNVEVPSGCVEASGHSFGYIFEPGVDDFSPPFRGLAPDTTSFTPFSSTTDTNGRLEIDLLESTGRYDLAELDTNDEPLADEQVLGFLCNGSFNLIDNNYEMTFIPERGITYCASFGTEAMVASPGDVVINEIMPAGIELRNTTDNDINLDGWYITGGSNSIELSGTILADDSFLISRLASKAVDLVLADLDITASGNKLVLHDAFEHAIDSKVIPDSASIVEEDTKVESAPIPEELVEDIDTPETTSTQDSEIPADPIPDVIVEDPLPDVVVDAPDEEVIEPEPVEDELPIENLPIDEVTDESSGSEV